MAVFLYYRQMAVKIFGGTTGDLSGWFTQTCELMAAMAALFVCRCA
jgi:adenosylcobinamide-GDP ribazoletransferase